MANNQSKRKRHELKMIKSGCGPEFGDNNATDTLGRQRNGVERDDNSKLVSEEDMGVAYRTPYEILRAIRAVGEIGVNEIYCLAPKGVEFDGEDIVRRSLLRLVESKKIEKVIKNDEEQPKVMYRALSSN